MSSTDTLISMNPNLTPLTKLLVQKKILLADGATGTNLFAMGLQNGESPELWNLQCQDKIAAHYDAFIEAGSDIILTNSFGGNRFRLALHQADDQVHDINYQSAVIAKQQISKSGRQVLVAGSIGPTGELPAPMGDLTADIAIAAFYEQAMALQSGGADVAWIETMSSLEEAEWAIQGAAQAGLESVCTFSFDTNGRSMMGVTPADAVQGCHHHAHPPTACGANCGVGAADLVMAINNMAQAQTKPSPLLVAKGNCGIPQYIDGEIAYTGTPELMANYVRLAAQAGASIIGGCCGTTPVHLVAMRKSLDDYLAELAVSTVTQKPLDLAQVVAELGEVTKGAQAQFSGDLSVAAGAAEGSAGKRRNRRR